MIQTSEIGVRMELIIFAQRVLLVLASRMLACDNDTLYLGSFIF